MDPVMATITIKGLGLVLALVFGFAIARYGFILFRDGAGHGRDEIGFSLGPVSATAKSVGSVVMATAFAWAAIGAWISPNLDQTANGVRVYSFDLGEVELLAPSFSAFVSASDGDRLLDNESVLKAVFAEEVEHGPISRSVLLNGQETRFDPASFTATSADGDVRLAARVDSRESSAMVTYEPKFRDGVLTFVPRSAVPSAED